MHMCIREHIAAAKKLFSGQTARSAPSVARNGPSTCKRALVPAGFTFESLPPPSKKLGTGRRSALARWLTRPDHPLTARVIVNRIWKHHFGRGIVATVDNFGTTGERPSHPELLDWLATEFVRNGWSIKWLHRQILTSATWQQSSLIHEPKGGADSVVSDDDRVSLLYGGPLRRMEAEVVRDSLLSLSGQLDLTPFGKPDSVTERPDGLVRWTVSILSDVRKL